MEIVLATNGLAGIGGSETYLLTVAEQLQRLGHAVTVHAATGGAMSEFVAERGLPVAIGEREVVRLRHPVDTQRLAPRGEIRERPRRAVLLGNYVSGRRRELIVEAWGSAGVECVSVGVHGTPSLDPASALADADIVVGKARSILDGMACGRAAYVLDVVGGDGWVTGERYAAMEADNFAGHVTDWSLDRERLVADLAGYRQDMGQVNRDLVLAHHDARSHAYELVALFRRLRPRPSSPTSPSCRGSRSARRRWWAPDPSSRGTCARARFVLGSPARFLRDVSDAELLERHAPPG